MSIGDDHDTGSSHVSDVPLRFEILAKCHTTRARLSRMTLPHGVTYTPAFMPVGS